MVKKGELFVISGPSGAGKGSINKVVCAQREDVYFSVSATSRKPREGEREGVEYFFLSEEEFVQKIEQDEFLEWAKVHGNYYGTLKSEVDKALSKGTNVLLEIDIQGAKQILEKGIGVFVFILPPSYDELKRRIVQRGSETPETLELRLRNALDEIRSIENYDYCIVNDHLEDSIKTLHCIITAESSKVRSELIELLLEKKERFSL